MLSGSASVKAERKYVGEIEPGFLFETTLKLSLAATAADISKAIG